MDYKTSGVCSKQIHVELDADKCVRNVSFVGGCNGNLKGIGSLVEGMQAEDAVKRLEGIRCGARATSCVIGKFSCRRTLDKKKPARRRAEKIK